jgi:hypothetical protein
VEKLRWWWWRRRRGCMDWRRRRAKSAI